MGVGGYTKNPKLLGLASFFLQLIFETLNDVFRVFFYFFHNKLNGLDRVAVCWSGSYSKNKTEFRITLYTVVFVKKVKMI